MDVDKPIENCNIGTAVRIISYRPLKKSIVKAVI